MGLYDSYNAGTGDVLGTSRVGRDASVPSSSASVARGWWGSLGSKYMYCCPWLCLAQDCGGLAPSESSGDVGASIPTPRLLPDLRDVSLLSMPVDGEESEE